MPNSRRGNGGGPGGAGNPGGPGGKTRILRCSYIEGGRRCVRNGVPHTNPPLCNVHVIVFSDMGRPPEPRSKVTDVLEDLLSGQRISRSDVEGAVSELFGNWAMGGNVAQGYYPDIGEDGRTVHDEGRTANPNFVPPSGFHPPPGWWPFGRGRGQSSPPPIDPEAAELAEARRRARQILGFAASEPVTADTLRVRYRKLARVHHPDVRGGNAEKMKIINDANDVLEHELAAAAGRR
jgi:hypothetical protein